MLPKPMSARAVMPDGERQARVLHVARQVQRHERRVHAADEVAPEEEVEAPLPEGLLEGFARGLVGGVRVHDAPGEPGGERDDESGRRREHEERGIPAEARDERRAVRHHRELAEGAAGADDPERDAALLRRDHLRDHAHHHAEGRARKRQADQQPGGEVERERRAARAPSARGPRCRRARSPPARARRRSGPRSRRRTARRRPTGCSATRWRARTRRGSSRGPRSSGAGRAPSSGARPWRASG